MLKKKHLKEASRLIVRSPIWITIIFSLSVLSVLTFLSDGLLDAFLCFVPIAPLYVAWVLYLGMFESVWDMDMDSVSKDASVWRPIEMVSFVRLYLVSCIPTTPIFLLAAGYESAATWSLFSMSIALGVSICVVYCKWKNREKRMVFYMMERIVTLSKSLDRNFPHDSILLEECATYLKRYYYETAIAK